MLLLKWWLLMKVKIFDESHESDLEAKVNAFLSTIKDKEIVDIKIKWKINQFLMILII